MPEHKGEEGVLDCDRAAVAFARVLRGAGLDVPIGATMVFGQALTRLGLEQRDGVYWAGRSTLVKRPEDIDTYDRAFAAFWLGIHRGPTAEVRPVQEVVLAIDTPLPEGDDDAPVAPPSDVPVLSLRWSRTEVLRHADFAAYTSAEFAEARKLMSDLRLVGALKPSRRRRPGAKRRGTPDLRRTVRRALRTGGEPLSQRFVEPAQQHRRIVLLLDVSGSMEPYARAFVRFMHAAVVGRTKVEAFALGTRLTRITKELSSRDPDAAVRAAAQRVTDWAGGTRLGEGLRTFNDTWGIRGMARGAVVVVLSDGWDRGAPDVLAEQMARLSRVSYKVIWVNPLKASPGYAPLAQGMAAALPYVDAFVEGHSLAALEELAEVMST